MARPKGRKNIEYEAVQEIPPACPSCGSTDLLVVKGKSPRMMEYTGVLHGRQYNRVIWRDKQCVGCGQFVCVRSYEKETNQVSKTERPQDLQAS